MVEGRLVRWEGGAHARCAAGVAARTGYPSGWSMIVHVEACVAVIGAFEAA